MLIAAFKVGAQNSLFNFEAVFQKYKAYMKSHASQVQIEILSKQAFIKIFLDLTEKGLLKSESETDILSVNNKIALGLRAKDLEEIILCKLYELELPEAIKGWLKM